MTITQKVSTILIALSLLILSYPAVTARAAHLPTYKYKGNIRPLNGTGSHGKIEVSVVGDTATVTIETNRISADLPHAQHLHIGGKMTCPASGRADANKDSFVSTVEGIPFYGGIAVSLTTEGDVSAASALALDRFPVANSDGVVTYSRTFELPEGVSGQDLADATLIQHGISELFDDNSQYDGDKKSSLPVDVPFEITVPTACAPLR